MKSAGYDVQQITEALNKREFAVPTEPLEIPKYVETPDAPPPPQDDDDDYFASHSNSPEPEPLSLTDEDKLYLRLKWGKTYKPEEWVALEQLYNDMMQSYDI